MSTMRAAFVVPEATGGMLEIRDTEIPAVGAGQVLVRVKAAGLNRGEVLYRRAARKGAPYIGGVEFAGEVAALGAGAGAFAPGDRVMGHGAATQAEYVVVEERALMPVPASLSWQEAAAFPNVFITAHDALVTAGGLRGGDNVLINAASSGIGVAAIQIARVLGAGAVVATSRSATKLAAVTPLGVTCAVGEQGLAQAVREATGGKGIDLAIDIVGGPALAETVAVLAMGGRLVNVGRMGGRMGELDMDRLSFFGLRIIGVSFRARSRSQTLDGIAACARDLLPHLASGAIRIPIERTYALADIAAAHDFAETDKHVGKIVITL